tara:strand:+ start:49 stop:798 length:750 start_codon:yes stop_codon:yes gene_type:complete
MPDAKSCARRVYGGTHSWGGDSCQRNATKNEDSKWWCYQHAPSAIAKQREKAHARYEAESQARREQYRRQTAERDACKNISTEALEAGVMKEWQGVLYFYLQPATRLTVEELALAIEEWPDVERTNLHLETARSLAAFLITRMAEGPRPKGETGPIWRCETCGFGMHAEHTTDGTDGEYDCPVCAETPGPSLDDVRAMVDKQAEDEGLWFVAETAPEAYLQQELRALHAEVEKAALPPETEEVKRAERS